MAKNKRKILVEIDDNAPIALIALGSMIDWIAYANGEIKLIPLKNLVPEVAQEIKAAIDAGLNAKQIKVAVYPPLDLTPDDPAHMHRDYYGVNIK